jgi:hypothetical protein
LGDFFEWISWGKEWEDFAGLEEVSGEVKKKKKKILARARKKKLRKKKEEEEEEEEEEASSSFQKNIKRLATWVNSTWLKYPIFRFFLKITK